MYDAARPSGRPWRRRALAAASWVLICAALGACDESFDEGRKLDPILVRQVIPADSVIVEKGEEFTLSIRFNRPVASDEVTVGVYPEPASLPEPRFSPTSHTMYFDAMRLNPEFAMHFLLIEGGNVVAPEILTWWDGQTQVAYVRGYIGSSEHAALADEGFVVFLLPPETGYSPDTPSSFENANPLAIASPRWSQAEEAFAYHFNSLPDGKPFFVVAVVDTDGDGHYEPEFDWWGAYGVREEQSFLYLDPVTTVTEVDQQGAQSYDFTLKRPGIGW